jgi:hypothetical protein
MSDFKWIVQSGNIVNNGVSLHDIEVAQQIWVNTLSVAALKGKTTKSDPPPVVADFVKVPQVILDANQEVTLTLSADMFFVNKILFLLTISRHLAFTTVSHLEDQKITTIFKHFRDVYKPYKKSGFKIILLLVDGEFAALQVLVHDMEHGPRVNLTSAKEHVPEVERSIRVVECVGGTPRGTTNTVAGKTSSVEQRFNRNQWTKVVCRRRTNVDTAVRALTLLSNSLSV